MLPEMLDSAAYGSDGGEDWVDGVTMFDGESALSHRTGHFYPAKLSSIGKKGSFNRASCHVPRVPLSTRVVVVF